MQIDSLFFSVCLSVLIIVKKMQVEFEINGIKFEALCAQDCGRIVQRNLKTLYERPVQMSVRIRGDEDKKSDDGWFHWQWFKSESNEWVPFSPSITIELELSYQIYIQDDESSASLSVSNLNNSNKKSGIFKFVPNQNSLKSNGRGKGPASYLIDFDTMKQKNEKSGFSRDVKRVAGQFLIPFYN